MPLDGLIQFDEWNHGDVDVFQLVGHDFGDVQNLLELGIVAVGLLFESPEPVLDSEYVLELRETELLVAVLEELHHVAVDFGLVFFLGGQRALFSYLQLAAILASEDLEGHLEGNGPCRDLAVRPHQVV